MKATKPTRGEVALARSVLYRLCAHAFRYPGDGWLEEWHETSRRVGSALEVLSLDGGEGRRLPEAFDLARASARDVGRLRFDHARLIGISLGGSASDDAAAEVQLRQLAGFRAFGLELSRAGDERVDVLALELSFLQFLCSREAQAEERDLGEWVAATRAGQMKFLAEHVLPWASACGTRLRGLGAETFYGHAATLLEGFLRSERVRFALADDGGAAAHVSPPRSTHEFQRELRTPSHAGVAGRG